jgi:hypothetical protein
LPSSGSDGMGSPSTPPTLPAPGDACRCTSPPTPTRLTCSCRAARRALATQPAHARRTSSASSMRYSPVRVARFAAHCRSTATPAEGRGRDEQRDNTRQDKQDTARQEKRQRDMRSIVKARHRHEFTGKRRRKRQEASKNVSAKVRGTHSSN